METKQEPSKVAEFRLLCLRASYFSIVVMEIFAIIQIHAMSSLKIKASQKDFLHGIVLISILPLVFVHHLASAFIPVNSSAIWFDLIFLVGEFCLFVWILTQSYAVIDPLSDRTSPFLVLASYAFVVCLAVLIILRIVDKIQKALPTKPESKGFWYDIRDVLCGHKIWDYHYTGEREWMIMFRGFLTLLFLVILPFYVAFNVIVQPLQKAALVSVRESWSRALPPDFKDVRDARWNVVITNFPDIPFDTPEMVQGVLKAVTIVKLVNDEPTEQCDQGTYIKATDTVPDHVSFNCLNATTEEIAQQGPRGITASIQHFVIVVYANYNQTSNSSVPLMHVRVGLTNDTVAVVKGTRPAILGEHQNMVGEGEVFVRRELTTRGLATLGVFSGWNTYLLTDIDQYFNDPNAVARGYAGPGVSSMIMNMENARYGYRVVEDYLEKSVLDGLSTIGGLFALISSVTMVLFGRSVLQIMFGSKPLALFGLVHKLDKDQIKASFGDKYSTLQVDLDTGFASLLRHHIVDIELAVNDTASQVAKTTAGTTKAEVTGKETPEMTGKETVSDQMSSVGAGEEGHN